MRIRFKKADLLPAAAIVQSVANPQSTLPILSNILIHTDHDNVVSLSATDYETRVRIQVAAEVEKKGTATLPAKTFYDLVKELPEDEDVTVEVKDKSAAVKSKGIRAELQTMPAKDFPKWPELTTKVSFEIEQRELKRLLSKILFAVPVRDPRKVLLGALFEFRKGLLNAVATDGKILAFVQHAIQGDKAPQDLNVVIPHKMLEELTRTLGDEGLVTMEVDDRQIAFTFNNLTLISNQVEGKYPNYNAVIPKEFSRDLRFQKSPMGSAIRRASILSDVKNAAISMAFSGDTVTVEAESYDKGRISEEVPANTDGDDFKIVFNYKFVGEVLKSIDTDEVVLQVNQPTSPAVFRGSENSDSFYLVMPIKLTELADYDEQGAGRADDREAEYSGAEMDEEP
ncbi:MAG: DNA polymerase III subunit beta [Candidatus Sumerlaeaceae bacterium]|nr:DNA polymerase III subunit beta [Candidatus Sumerlaeaceae bacterium]